MPRTVKVLMAKDPISVQALADHGGWTIIYPIHFFDDIGSDYHPDLGANPGALFYTQRGHVALAYQDT